MKKVKRNLKVDLYLDYRLGAKEINDVLQVLCNKRKRPPAGYKLLSATLEIRSQPLALRDQAVWFASRYIVSICNV